MSTPADDPSALVRRLGTWDAVVIGLGSMVGAGVFAAFAPAARAAGAALLLGLLLAGIVAYCNATASAQLAAQCPTSGGTYVYGRERLGPWPGFLAGWAFVVGKTASCAAMALTFAAYVAPADWERPLAALAVAALAGANYTGVQRTAALTRVVVAVVVLVLVAAAAVGVGGARDGVAQLLPADATWSGVLQSAGLLFFAFAGYARIATLGEEVREPRRTIPRAVRIALALAFALYLLVAVMLLLRLGPVGLAATTAPVAEAVAGTWLAPAVRVAAALAALGALLSLLAGIGRTVLAMGRTGDLPRWLAAVHPRFAVPHRAEVVVAVVVCALVLTVDLRGAIGFSSFGVLLYYAVANAAAVTQTGAWRLSPRALQVAGLAGCLVLAATLPTTAVLGGLLVLAAGVAYRAVGQRVRRA